MRGTTPGLPTPHPLLHRLPGIYLEHDFVRRLLDALDEILAPVLLTLDNLPAHLDPRTAPDDFLSWVATWVAVEADDACPIEQRRATVSGAVARHRRRGTARALAEAIELETGLTPDITETGASRWSSTPHTEPPGDARPHVLIRIPAPDPTRVDRTRLERLVAAEVPAHVAVTIDIGPPT